MRRILAFLAALAAGATLVELFRRRRSTGAKVPERTADERVDELRRRLADRRESEPGTETEPEAEPPPDAPLPPVDDARRRVHDEARTTLEEMRRQGQI